jgi:23S rRNA G2445 N2-methylase RlmL
MKSQRWDKLFDIPRQSNVVCEEGSLPWQLQIHVTTSKSKLMHTKAVEERVRKSIGELLGVKDLDSDPDAGITNSTDNGAVGRPVVRLLIRIDRDEVQLSLDTSSASSAIPLHMRGYRLNPHRAPLREDLAFALLMAGGLKPRWNLQPLKSFLTMSDIDNSLDKGEKTGEERLSLHLHLFDPLCGSGTIAIEAASILAGLPPGRFRPPPLEATTMLNTSLWNDIKSKALSVSTSSNGTENSIMVAGNDISKEAIDAAISNAKRAGVDHIIDFTVGTFKTHPLSNHSRRHSTAYQISDSRDLLLVTNPPYGKRLVPDKTSMSIYKQIANAMKAVPYGVQFTMLGKEPRLLRESSLPFNVAFSTKQGGISVVAMSTGAMDKKPGMKNQ